jgi:hypothetical protein
MKTQKAAACSINSQGRIFLVHTNTVHLDSNQILIIIVGLSEMQEDYN